MSCYKYLHCRGKPKVSYHILLRDKQKYHITSCSSKLSWKHFLRPVLCWNCNSNEHTVKLNTKQFSKWRRRTDVSNSFCWNASSYANKMFLKLIVIKSLTNYLIFSSAWLPYGISHYEVFKPILFIRHGLPAKTNAFQANLAYNLKKNYSKRLETLSLKQLLRTMITLAL